MSEKLGRRASAALLCLALATSLFALNPRRPLRTYEVDVYRDGLPQRLVQAITQTSDGALWVAMYEGLARFDGADFVSVEPRLDSPLPNWRPRVFCELAPGELWIGTAGTGLIRYRYMTGGFRRFSIADGLPSDAVTALVRGRDGTLWVGTSAGMARLGTGGRIERIGARADVRGIAEDRDGTLLVASDNGLFRLSPRGMTSVSLPLPSARLTCVDVTRDGEIWIGTRDGVVLRGRDGAWQTIRNLGGLPTYWVNFIRHDRDGNVWLGIAPGGIARYSGGRFDLLASALPSTSVRAFFEDAERSIWIGTNGGLARLKDLKFYGWSERTGLPEDNVRVVMPARGGGMWLGTYGAGLTLLRDGQVTTYGTREGLSDPFVRTVAESPVGTVWVGTASGLNAIRGGRVSRDAAPRIFAGKKITALLALADGAVIVASEELPLQIMRRGVVAAAVDDPKGETRNARVIVEDGGGALWIGTDRRGLLGARSSRIVQRWTRKNGLPADAVLAVVRRAGGGWWLGTHDGLALLGDRGVVSLAGPGGLPAETIFQVIDDGGANVWLTTNRGVLRVARAALDARVSRGAALHYDRFDARDGMPASQCNGASQPAGVRLPDGSLAVPTTGGLAVFDPSYDTANRVPPPVHISAVMVNGRSVSPATRAKLPWSADRFEFRYEGLSFLQPERVTYRYRVDGFDAGWVEAGTRRAAFYNSLPAGRHTFRVQARNNDGVMSAREATFAFERPAAPWLRWWAFLAYAAAATALIWWLLRLRTRMLRRTNQRLESRVRERTAQLQTANEQLHANSRQMEELNARLAALATTDGLTGVANRRRFDEAVDAEFRRATRSGAPVALMLIDVDHFKVFNDTYGHQNGDECLRHIAAAAAASFQRTGDLVARYGGEEFAVVLPNTSQLDALHLANELCRNVAQSQIVVTSAPATRVTISVGVATSDIADSAEALVRLADGALYEAKRGGRNQARLVDPAPARPLRSATP